jgi:hypothetical protein
MVLRYRDISSSYSKTILARFRWSLVVTDLHGIQAEDAAVLRSASASITTPTTCRRWNTTIQYSIIELGQDIGLNLHLHLMDRTANGGNLAWGQCQTLIKEACAVLQRGAGVSSAVRD